MKLYTNTIADTIAFIIILLVFWLGCDDLLLFFSFAIVISVLVLYFLSKKKTNENNGTKGENSIIEVSGENYKIQKNKFNYTLLLSIFWRTKK